MTERGYSSSALVQIQLRRTLTTDELADADRKIAAVEQFLDAWSGQTYSATGQITDEMVAPLTQELPPAPVTSVQLNPYYVTDPVSQLGWVRLKGTPVGNIVSVRSRPNGTSQDDVGWIPADSVHPGSVLNGVLSIPGYANYPYVFVTYNSLAGVPEIFREITTQIVAAMMPFGGSGGVPNYAGPLTSYSLGGDLSMSFASSGFGGTSGQILAGIPSTVWPLLISIKRWSIG